MLNLQFIKHRKLGYLFSGVILLALLVTFFFNGLTLDITFRGGTRMTFETNGAVDTAEAASIARDVTGREVNAAIMETVDAANADNRVAMLRLDVAGSEPLSDDESALLREAMSENFNVQLDSSRNETISITPSIGRETLGRGLLAVVISSLLILFYVAWRFTVMSGFSAAFTAVLALIHDAGIIFGIYIAFRLPLNEGFIAALLTVIGYSINDTIIIYDRIRENSGIMRKSGLEAIVNTSLSQSLTRSLNTTITTVICLASLYVFSAIYNIPSLRDFSLSLTIGIISGCYSSMFVAVPLWYEQRERKLHKKLKTATS